MVLQPFPSWLLVQFDETELPQNSVGLNLFNDENFAGLEGEVRFKLCFPLGFSDQFGGFIVGQMQPFISDGWVC